MTEAEHRERKCDRHKIAALQGSLKAVADDLEHTARDRAMEEPLREELLKMARVARLCAR